MRKSIIVALGLVILYLLSGIHRVGPSEQAIVVRFGEVVSIRGPGLWLSFPWGIDTVYKVETDRVRQVVLDDVSRDSDDTDAQFVTGDQNLVTISALIEYSIRHSSIDEEYLLQEQSIAEILKSKGRAGVSEWIARINVDDALLNGRSRLSIWLNRYLEQELNRIGIGVVIHRVNVVKIAPPPEVQDSFDAVAKAEIGVATQIHDAERLAKQRTEEARIEVHRLKQSSIAYRDSRLQAAQSEANAFLLRAKWLDDQGAGKAEAMRRIWWETMTQLIGNLNKQGRIQIVDDRLNTKEVELLQVIPRDVRGGAR